MNRIQQDIAASLAALDPPALPQPKPRETESGLNEEQERRIVLGHNRAATLIQVAAVIAGGLAAPFFGIGFLIFGVFVAWLFGKARLK